MVPGTSVKSSKEALRLTRIYPGIIYSTAGIHPHDSKSIIEEPSSWHDFQMIASAPECVAIGPCGLDYQRDFSEPCTQKEIFERQLQLAAELGKPILIHERSAQEDVLEILTRYVERQFPGTRSMGRVVRSCSVASKLYFQILFDHNRSILLTFYRFQPTQPIIVRGFMGTTDEALKYLEREYYISLTGYLCKVMVDKRKKNWTYSQSRSFRLLLVCSFYYFAGQIWYRSTEAARRWTTANGALAGGDGLTVHVSEYSCLQAAAACKGRSDGTFAAVLASLLYLPAQWTVQFAGHRRDDSGIYEQEAWRRGTSYRFQCAQTVRAIPMMIVHGRVPQKDLWSSSSKSAKAEETNGKITNDIVPKRGPMIFITTLFLKRKILYFHLLFAYDCYRSPFDKLSFMTMECSNRSDLENKQCSLIEGNLLRACEGTLVPFILHVSCFTQSIGH